MTMNKSSDTQAKKGREAGREDQPTAERQLTVVGLGASAGGLAALQGFFDAMPAGTGMAFVVITHMDPERESLLPEILQQHTAMPVRQVTDMVAIEADHVYVISPNRRILITDTHLETEPFAEPRGRRTPIDDFFRSLAAAHREAAAVIFSGGGTDGAVGIKAVKEKGGLLMVQEPGEAEHDSMPRAAIATGLADVVLPAARLARKLVEYQNSGLKLARTPEALNPEQQATVYHILAEVQAQTGHDFSQYKRSTVVRRIQRRMQLRGLVTLDAYLDALHTRPSEAQALFNDLLIGVTNFFRDNEAWEAVSEQVIPHLFDGKGQRDAVRVWTIGCATGEEAYTLAMLLLEQRAALASAAPPKIQVFASDLDQAALDRAREGLYPEAIETDVSPERLARFFVKEGNHYRVRQKVRDLVLFANHSVLRDPPFSRLDLISCRNLLIYLDRDLQENVFQIFHYALAPEGYLFLGSAESIDKAQDLFNTVDKSHRLYRARSWRGAHPPVPTLPLTVPKSDQPKRAPTLPGAWPRTGQQTVATTAGHLSLLEESAPPSLVVDESYQVIHLSETAGRYLHHPGGATTGDLLKLVRPELQFELRSALFQAFAHGKRVVSTPVRVRFDPNTAGSARRVTLAVRPRQSPAGTPHDTSRKEDGERLALVFFLEDEVTETAGDEQPLPEAVGDEARRNAVLEAEVLRLRQRLQTTTEEYERSNEELKAANEELQSINEEYRSTTEELETSKEELQSLNEELETVNAELKNKLEEISRAHSDLENLMAATDIASLFLDRELRIQRYTPGTTELFNIRPADRGRPVGDLTNKLDYGTLADDAARVLKTLVPFEREIQDVEGRWLLARLRPYRSIEDHIDGIVLTLVDVTELKEAEEAVRAAKEYGEKIIHTVREALLVLQPDLTVEFANDSFYEMFTVSEADTVGNYIYDLGDGQWDIPQLRTLLEELLPQEKIFNGYRVERTFDEAGHRVMLLNARRLDHVDLILLAIEDVTQREEYEENLRVLNETLEQRVEQRTRQVRALASQLTMAEHEERARIAEILHDDLQQQLYGLQIQLSLLRNDTTDEALLKEIEEMQGVIETATKTARRLSVELSPPVLEGEGLTEAIGWLSEQMHEQYRLQVKVEAEGSFAVPELDRRVLLFQAVRELLFNIVKHAGVPEATVMLRVIRDPEMGQLYRIDVLDEGVGFDRDAVLGMEAAPHGRGLPHIRERLRFIGGRLELASAPGDGAQVTIIVPPGAGAFDSREQMDEAE